MNRNLVKCFVCGLFILLNRLYLVKENPLSQAPQPWTCPHYSSPDRVLVNLISIGSVFWVLTKTTLLMNRRQSTYVGDVDDAKEWDFYRAVKARRWEPNSRRILTSKHIIVKEKKLNDNHSLEPYQKTVTIENAASGESTLEVCKGIM